MTAHKYDDAIRYFKDALALERVTGDRGADSVRVRFSLAQGLEAIGKRDEATAVAREAVELSKSTDDPRAYLVATRIYASLLADRDATTRGALDAARVAWNAADDYRRKILASNAVDIDKNNANSFAKVAEEVLLRVEKAQNLPHLSK